MSTLGRLMLWAGDETVPTCVFLTASRLACGSNPIRIKMCNDGFVRRWSLNASRPRTRLRVRKNGDGELAMRQQRQSLRFTNCFKEAHNVPHLKGPFSFARISSPILIAWSWSCNSRLILIRSSSPSRTSNRTPYED